MLLADLVQVQVRLYVIYQLLNDRPRRFNKNSFGNRASQLPAVKSGFHNTSFDILLPVVQCSSIEESEYSDWASAIGRAHWTLG